MMRRLLPLGLLAACASQSLPLAPGDDGGSRGGFGFGLPAFGSGTAARPVAATQAPELPLEPADEVRLARLKETVAAALFDAFAAGGADRTMIASSASVLTAAPLPLTDGPIAGRYRCRTLKHGGPVPFITYGWFDCAVKEGKDGLTLSKPDGSQRMAGRLFRAPGLGADGLSALAYAGTEYHQGEKPVPYPEGRNEVGLFERIGENRFRLLLPEPGVEGRLDVIELERIGERGA
ncbi:DUF4893 domain-containing protein [Parvularcula dongshanensis]|uniref:DUF4893 domain-containing protein n=1 Tax=Parvularcula dongshanensis TaxID=1173995 RepID=A0A840HYE7_9PROT|nr:DUF4893 domain-containing protein [Parvularcula dongshanensis]MBB4657876.1 hypothetical protein [Parvularcula dongshanensis]